VDLRIHFEKHRRWVFGFLLIAVITSVVKDVILYDGSPIPRTWRFTRSSWCRAFQRSWCGLRDSTNSWRLCLRLRWEHTSRPCLHDFSNSADAVRLCATQPFAQADRLRRRLSSLFSVCFVARQTSPGSFSGLPRPLLGAILAGVAVRRAVTRQSHARSSLLLSD